MIYQKVLLPIDLQAVDHVEDQLVWAAEKAAGDGVSLRLVCVLPGYGMSIVAAYFPTSARQSALQDAKAHLESLADKHLKGRDYSVVVREGRPHEQIIEEAREFGAELIALSHNTRKGDTQPFGSVAQRVAERAECSVLVIR